MNSDVLIGGFASAFGAFTLVMRFVAPDSKLFSKLGPMKEQFGEKAGLAIHVVAYSLLPLVLGLTMLGRGLS